MNEDIEIIYLDDYATDEEVFIRSCGIRTLRIRLESSDFSELQLHSSRAILRGGRIGLSDYRRIEEGLLASSTQLSTTAHEFDFLSSSDLYEGVLQSMAPDSITIDGSRAIWGRSIASVATWERVFVRSEMGSAAKKFGLDSCVVRDFDEVEIDDKINALINSYPDARRLIIKKMEAVRVIDGHHAEGRFIVIAGKYFYLDYCELPSQELSAEFNRRNASRAESVIRRFQSIGIYGDYFVDIAETVDDRWFVVEVKSLVNGTIRDLVKFSNFLRNLKD